MTRQIQTFKWISIYYPISSSQNRIIKAVPQLPPDMLPLPYFKALQYFVDCSCKHCFFNVFYRKLKFSYGIEYFYIQSCVTFPYKGISCTNCIERKISTEAKSVKNTQFIDEYYQYKADSLLWRYTPWDVDNEPSSIAKMNVLF